MLSVKIVMDEEKILREKLYSLEWIYQTIDYSARDLGLKKIDKCTYICPNGEDDSRELVVFLKQMTWFKRNAKEWLILGYNNGIEDIMIANKEIDRDILGTRIVMDEEKIIREKQYSLESIYQIIDEIAKECNLVKRDKYTYICKNGEEDSQFLGIFHYDYLIRLNWFTQNVKEWILLDDEGYIDLIKRNKARGKGDWND